VREEALGTANGDGFAGGSLKGSGGGSGAGRRR
jgi:hypothetical protein